MREGGDGGDDRRMFRRSYLVLLAAAALAAPAAATAAPSDLDPAFGSGGVARIAGGSGRAVALTSDGGAVVVGPALAKGQKVSSGFAVARFDAAGNPVAGFGNG